MGKTAGLKTEAQVRDPVIRWARKNKILHMRNHKGPGAEAGWPDDFFFLPGGRLYMVEFKRPGEVASKLQEHRINDLKRQGYDVSVHDSTEAAVEAIHSRCARRG